MRRIVLLFVFALAPAIAQAQQAKPPAEQECPAAQAVTTTCVQCQAAKIETSAPGETCCCSAAQQVVMYSFSAPWCAPCQEMKKTLADEDVAKCLSENCKVIAVNIDDQSETAKKYEVTAIPAQVFVSADGKVIKKVVGLQDKDKLMATIKSIAKPAVKVSANATFTLSSPKITIKKSIQGENEVTAVANSDGENVIRLMVGGKPVTIKAKAIRIQDNNGDIRLECEGTKVQANNVITARVIRQADGNVAKSGTITVHAEPAQAAKAQGNVFYFSPQKDAKVVEGKPHSHDHAHENHANENVIVERIHGALHEVFATEVAAASQNCPAEACATCPACPAEASATCQTATGCPACNQCPHVGEEATAALSNLAQASVHGFWQPAPYAVAPPANYTASSFAAPAARPYVIKPSEEAPTAGAYCVVTTQGERHSYAGEFVRMTAEFIIVKENGTTHWIPRHSVECLSVTEEKLAEAPAKTAVSTTGHPVFPHPVALPYPGMPYPAVAVPSPMQYFAPAEMEFPAPPPMMPAPAAHTVPAKGMFHIDLTLKDGDEIISQPHLITVARQRACVQVGKSTGENFYAGVEVHTMPNSSDVVGVNLFSSAESEKPCGQIACTEGQTVSVPWSYSGKEGRLILKVREHQGDQSCCQAAKPQAKASEVQVVRVYQVGMPAQQKPHALSDVPVIRHFFGEQQPTMDEVCEAIEACCPGTWAHDGGAGKVVSFEESGCVVVCQTPEVHAQIADMLRGFQHHESHDSNAAVQTPFEFALPPIKK